jgi:hypothetical protein
MHWAWGPCQYVLDSEGIGAKDNPTPEQVTRWLEKQLEKKPARRDADAMREQIKAMVEHGIARLTDKDLKASFSGEASWLTSPR